MNERTAEAIRIMRYRIFSEQSGRCFWCGMPVTITGMELAHRVPQRVWTLKLWGEAVIHHHMNLRGTHPGSCNSHAQLNPDSLEAEELVRDIQRVLKKEETATWRKGRARA